MQFRVTRHATAAPPEHALDLLSERIPSRRDDVLFTKAGNEIRARLDRDESVLMTQDERSEIGRQAVLEAISEVCERVPELKFSWYAVSPSR